MTGRVGVTTDRGKKRRRPEGRVGSVVAKTGYRAPGEPAEMHKSEDLPASSAHDHVNLKARPRLKERPGRKEGREEKEAKLVSA